MNEFLCVNSYNQYTLVCRDTKEAYQFDSYGVFLREQDFSQVLSNCGLPTKVSLCSVCGKPPYLDIYVNGMRNLYEGLSVSQIINKIRKSASDLLQVTIPFRIHNKEMIPHVILVMKKEVTYKDICQRAGLSDVESWVSVTQSA